MLDLLYTALDKNEYPLGPFINLKKAFDKVDHSILLLKLNHYRIRGHVLAFIKSYLTKRKQ